VTQLNAWTKIGDNVDATGRWTLYRHTGRQLSEVEKVLDWEGDSVLVASGAYTSRVKLLTRGGLWLVSPEGKVALATWRVPLRNRVY
jgi:hypothetical protein